MTLSFITPGRIKAIDLVFEPGLVPSNLIDSLRPRSIPTTVAVLERPNGDVVLVDVGFSREEMQRPIAKLGWISAALTPIEGTGADCAAAQLERRGISAERVTHIVATHLHLDHIGAYVDFPNAELVASAAEYSSGKVRGRLDGYLHVHSMLRSGRARPVALSDEGRYGFPRHHDLFGDGTVVLLDARGHSAGHAAVMVRDPDTDRAALMAGDAAFSKREYRLAQACMLMRLVGWDLEKARATWGALYDFELQHPDIPVVLSHDAETFAGLCHP